MIENYTFCHIPKTAGLTISSLLFDHIPGHYVCSPKNSKPFLFTFVRNPYSRFLSAFFYLQKGGGNELDLEDSKIYIGNSNINDFIMNKLKFAINNQQHFRPQHYWIPDGADFIGKYENLINDIKKLRSLIKTRKKSIRHLNKTNYDPSFKLSQVQKDIVYYLYKKDFELFDYQR